MAPAPSVERVLRGVLRYLADALMLQLMSGGWMPWVGWRGSGRVGLGVFGGMWWFVALRYGPATGMRPLPLHASHSCLHAPVLPPLNAADAVPAFNIFGLQRLFSDLGGIRRAARWCCLRVPLVYCRQPMYTTLL